MRSCSHKGLLAILVIVPSDVIINIFDDFFQKTGSIKNSVTFKIPNKFTCRTENHFSNPSQSEICKNTYPKILEGLMSGIHASAEKRPVYVEKSCPVLLYRLHSSYPRRANFWYISLQNMANRQPFSSPEPPGGLSTRTRRLWGHRIWSPRVTKFYYKSVN